VIQVKLEMQKANATTPCKWQIASLNPRNNEIFFDYLEAFEAVFHKGRAIQWFDQYKFPVKLMHKGLGQFFLHLKSLGNLPRLCSYIRECKGPALFPDPNLAGTQSYVSCS
jgi:hypothetical protein